MEKIQKSRIDNKMNKTKQIYKCQKLYLFSKNKEIYLKQKQGKGLFKIS